MASGAKRNGRLFQRGYVCRCCAGCCREMVVPVNDADVRRLMAVAGLHPERIVGFYNRGHVEYDGRSPLWFRTRHGLRIMALRRSGDKCRFLDRDGRCRVYGARPSTCRTFPYEIRFSGRRRPHIERTDWPLCRSRPAAVPDREAVMRARRREIREDTAFVRRLRSWETAGNGKTANLLRFLFGANSTV